MIFHFAQEEIMIKAVETDLNIKLEIPLRKNGEVIQSYYALIKKLLHCATTISAL